MIGLGFLARLLQYGLVIALVIAAIVLTIWLVARLWNWGIDKWWASVQEALKHYGD